MSLFITFEGPDASGKSTQVALLKNYLQKVGVPLLVTKEPGGTDLGEDIAEMIFGHRMAPLTEAMLFAANRAEHVVNVIKPALEEGAWVVCDRFTDSSLIYQGIAREVPMEVVQHLNELATGGLTPDLTILLDVPVEESLRRLEAKGTAKDRFEAEVPGFHQIVREHYLAMAKAESNRFRVFDGTKDPVLLHIEIREAVEAMAARKLGREDV